MTAVPQVSADADFLQGLRSQLGKRVRVWYDVDLSESGAARETVEGRLTAVGAELILDESRLIHPSTRDDNARRTVPADAVRGYNVLDQRTGLVTGIYVRPGPPTP